MTSLSALVTWADREGLASDYFLMALIEEEGLELPFQLQIGCGYRHGFGETLSEVLDAYAEAFGPMTISDY